MLLLASLLSATTAQAKVIEVTKEAVKASSTEPAADEVNYEAENLIDSKQSTVWVEGDSGSGLGAWVEIDLGGDKSVTGFKIWNGVWFTKDMWERHNRIHELEVELADGSRHTFNLKDEFEPEVIKLPKTTTTSKVKFKIKTVYAGSTFSDTGISEIQVLDPTADSFYKVDNVTASSVFPADSDGNYEPINTVDGMADSMWCEGSAGDGSGEWLLYEFGGPTKVSNIHILNGNGYSVSALLNANTAKTATLTFSDGSTKAVTLSPSTKIKEIPLGAHTTNSVKITFDSIKPGKEYNDLCISELYFTN